MGLLSVIQSLSDSLGFPSILAIVLGVYTLLILLETRSKKK